MSVVLIKGSRCSATTKAGRRCRHSTHAESKLCPQHTIKVEEFYDQETFDKIYYGILRALYNVAGEEMQEEYELYKRLGKKAYHAHHTKHYTNFTKLIDQYGI